MYLTVCGADPGKVNFGVSVVRVMLEPPFRYKVVYKGMLTKGVTSLTGGVRHRSKAFRAEMSRILRLYNVDVLVAERFQNRGRMNGTTLELVNYMLGVMDGLRVKDYFMITASQWKNSFNRRYDLKAFYKEVPVVPHMVDSTLIALYGAQAVLNFKEKQFEFVDNESIKKLRYRIGDTNG